MPRSDSLQAVPQPLQRIAADLDTRFQTCRVGEEELPQVEFRGMWQAWPVEELNVYSESECWTKC